MNGIPTKRKLTLDTVNQGNWCLSIKFRLECFVIVAQCKQYVKALTYSKKQHQNTRLLALSIRGLLKTLLVHC